MKQIAIFFGGASVEHDVSVITGVMTLNTVDKEKFRPIPIYVDESGKFFTGEKLFDPDGYRSLDVKTLTEVCLLPGDNVLYSVKKGRKIKKVCSLSAAVNCMHGERGEDGALAGLLELCGVPLASPDIAASSVCMDKAISKIFMKGLNVKTVPGVCVTSVDDLKKIKKPKFPVIVKPAKSGSSIGIERAFNEEELFTATSKALRYSERVVIERLITGFTEINCAAYRASDGKIVVSECERPVGVSEVLSFEDKYGGGTREFPANIASDQSREVRKITEKVYESLNCNGLIRVDYIIKDDVIYLNEVNTVPGSLAYYLFCDTFKDFSKVLSEVVAVSEAKFAKSETLIKSFSSGILKGMPTKGAKRL